MSPAGRWAFRIGLVMAGLVLLVVVGWFAWPRAEEFSAEDQTKVRQAAAALSTEVGAPVADVRFFPVHNPLGPDAAMALIDFRSAHGPFTPAELAAAKEAVIAFGWTVDGDCRDDYRTASGRCQLGPAADVNMSGDLIRVVFPYRNRGPAIERP